MPPVTFHHPSQPPQTPSTLLRPFSAALLLLRPLLIKTPSFVACILYSVQVFLSVFSICRIPPLANFISFLNPSLFQPFHHSNGGQRETACSCAPTIPSIFGPLFENSCFRPIGISQSLPSFSIPGPPRLLDLLDFHHDPGCSSLFNSRLAFLSHRSRQISFHPPHLSPLAFHTTPASRPLNFVSSLPCHLPAWPIFFGFFFGAFSSLVPGQQNKSASRTILLTSWPVTYLIQRNTRISVLRTVYIILGPLLRSTLVTAS